MALNFETKPFPVRVSLLRAAGVHTVTWSSAREAPGWAWGANQGIIKGRVPWKPEDVSYVVTSRGQLCRRHSPMLDSASWTRRAGCPHPRPAPGATFAARLPACEPGPQGPPGERQSHRGPSCSAAWILPGPGPVCGLGAWGREGHRGGRGAGTAGEVESIKNKQLPKKESPD